MGIEKPILEAIKSMYRDQQLIYFVIPGNPDNPKELKLPSKTSGTNENKWYIGSYPKADQAARVVSGVIEWFKWVQMQDKVDNGASTSAAGKGASVQTQIDDFMPTQNKRKTAGESYVNNKEIGTSVVRMGEADADGDRFEIGQDHAQQLGMVVDGFATQTTAINEAAARQNAANIEAAARQNTENNEAVASRQTESLALISSQGERFTKALIEQATLHAETQSKMLKVIHSFAQGGT